MVAAGSSRLCTRRSQMRARRAVAELAAGVLEESQHIVGDTRPAMLGIAGDEAKERMLPPPISPLANGLAVEAKSPTRGQQTMFDRVRHDDQALLHAQAVLRRNGHLLRLVCHGTSLSSGHPPAGVPS